MSITDTILIDNYFGLLSKLSPEMKKKLIEQLKKTLDSGLKASDKTSLDAFGAWYSDKSADEIIQEIKESRFTNRQIETF